MSIQREDIEWDSAQAELNTTSAKRKWPSWNNMAKDNDNQGY